MTTPLSIPNESLAGSFDLKGLSIPTVAKKASPLRALSSVLGSPENPSTAQAKTLDQYPQDINGNYIITDPLERDQNFNHWFKQSKIQEQSGTPIVMYHGAQQFVGDQFDPNKQGTRDEGSLGKGFYFTNGAEKAGIYAETPIFDIYGEAITEAPAPEMLPVWLSVQNPIVIGREGELDDKTWNILKKHIRSELSDRGDTEFFDMLNTGDLEPNFRFDALSDIDAFYNYPISKMAQDAGFDAIMTDDLHEVNVFDPTQIKSIHNRGWFNPDDPDILANQSDTQDRETPA